MLYVDGQRALSVVKLASRRMRGQALSSARGAYRTQPGPVAAGGVGGGGEGPPKGKSLGRPRPRAQDRAQQPLASLLEYRTCSRANQANASIESERVGRGFECFSVYNLQLEPLGRPRSPLNLASWRLLGSRGGEQAKRKSSVSVVWRWKECVCVCVGVVRWSWWSREH